MSDDVQWKVSVAYQDGEDKTYRHARSVGFNEFGAMVIEQPREHPKGRVIIPFALPGMFIKYAVIEEETILDPKSSPRLVTP